MSSNDEQRELDESSLKKKKKRTRNACDTLKTRHIYEMDRPEKVFAFFFFFTISGIAESVRRTGQTRFSSERIRVWMAFSKPSFLTRSSFLARVATSEQTASKLHTLAGKYVRAFFDARVSGSLRVF